MAIEVKTPGKRGRKAGYKMSEESKVRLREALKASWAIRKEEAAYLASVNPVKQGYKDTLLNNV